MFGPYQLEYLIGRGGMGEVFRATDTRKRNRTVALKRLPAHLADDKDFQARFRREAELAASLSNPHAIPIHDYGEIAGQLFIDMRLVEGEDLAEIIGRSGKLELKRAMLLARQVASALDAAHSAGLVHRDVKPSNILVANSGSDEFAYLIDFGIARSVNGTKLTLTGTALGTLAYMAPERFDGEGDHRSDIYAFACVVYEMLTGQQPFHQNSALGYMRAHSDLARPRPSVARPGLPLLIDAVVARGMAKAPTDRFTTAGAFSAAVEAALQPESRQQAQPSKSVPTGSKRRTAEFDQVTRPPAPSTRLNSPPVLAADKSKTKTPGLLLSLGLVLIVAAIVAAATILGPPGGPNNLLSYSGVFAIAAAELDGKSIVVTGASDQDVRAWDLSTRSPLGPAMTGHTAYVTSVTTAELDGQLMAISAGGGGDGTIRVWDPVAGTQIGEPIAVTNLGVHSVASTLLDGRPVIIAGAGDGSVRAWDLRTRALIGTPFLGHENEVWAVTSAILDGRPIVVSAGRDQSIRLWDLATGLPVRDPLLGHTDQVRALHVYEMDGRPTLVSGSLDDSIKIWDISSGEPFGDPLYGHTGSISDVEVATRDGQSVVVSASFDDSIRLWDPVSGDLVGAPFSGGSNLVRAIAISNLSSEFVVVSGGDDTVRIWNLTTGEAM